MKLNINQITLYCFGAGFVGVAVFFMKHDENGLASLSLIGALLLILVAAVEPKTIQNLGFRRGAGSTEFGINRYTPSPQEFEEALALGSRDTDTSIADNPLVEAAQERSPDEKAATDYMLLATNAWKEKRYDEGFQYAYQGLALNPVRRIKASLETRLGILFYELNVIDMAEKIYRQAIETDPKFFGSHNNLGLLLADHGRPEEAEAAYRQAIDIDPDLAAVHMNLGILLAEQGRPEDAEAAYRKALNLNPDHAATYNNLGNLLAWQGRSEEAEAAYRKALALDPTNAKRHSILGDLLASQGRDKEAEQHIAQAKELEK